LLHQRPLLSICCVAFNHEDYIEQSIDGFLSQKTTFPFEIIIHDDASTDNTQDIIKHYYKQRSNIIKPFLQTKNQYSISKFTFIQKLFQSAQGRYIALCEGDDYWTDPFKLQKQVDFLEKSPEFSICFHKVMILEDGYLRKDYLTRVPSQVSTIIDLAQQGNYIHTPSCVFRNNASTMFGSNFSKSPIGDYYIHMMNAQLGKLYHMDEAMAVYRIHPQSIWSNKDLLHREINFQRSRLAILKDLKPTATEACQTLSEAYINKALELYSRTGDISIKEDIVSHSSILVDRIIDVAFIKQIELDKANNEIAVLRKRQLFRRLCRFIRFRIFRITSVR
jgi:glycosyltransferase involved in cell wall biosynthesis